MLLCVFTRACPCIFTIQDAIPINEAALLPKQATPCLLLRGKRQMFLAIDKVPVMEVDVTEGPLALLAAHYVFNIRYPVGLESVYTFLEFLFMNRTPTKQGIVFNRFFSAIHA